MVAMEERAVVVFGWEWKSSVGGGALYEGATVVLESSGFETTTMKRGEASVVFPKWCWRAR